uniref:Acyl-coenzyme A oxidase n=1 Tax=Chaetoceros debilis TaxID=122233 RepID=A0A7S3VF91_9STRA
MACNLPTGGIPSTVNPDLIQERAKATFDPSAITAFFDGDASRQRTKTARRRQLESLIANDPSGVFDNDTNNYMHRTERHVRSLAKHVRLIELCRSLGFGDPAKHGNNGNSSVNDVNDSVSPGEVLLDSEWYDISAALADDLPTALHWVMFLPNIISLCDEEQQKRFLPLCRDWRMIGCYAQTEVGHGSNVRALETTATFLKEGEHCPTTGQVAPISIGGGGGGGGAWIINSPTLTSTKFWPGTLGRTCNHAMVIARLIDAAGVDHGVHNFLVQTRSMEDHSLMPGVTCGDIGPKIGYNVMDNGFAKFEHVLIPRRNMAMRFAVVDEDGVYSKKTVSDAASKVAYITMMQVRSYIILEASKALRLGTTMVIRYSAVRKQGFTHNNGNGGDGDGDSSKEENQILDYMQQQHRLFPLLASSYCIFFTGKKMLADLKAIEDRLVKLVESDGTDTGGEGEGEGEGANKGSSQGSVSSTRSVDHISFEELNFGFSSFHAMTTPVVICMILSALAVTFIQIEEQRDIATETMTDAYTVIDISNPSNSNLRNFGASLVNGLVIVSVVAAMTFLIVILYKYRCMKLLLGYMVLSSGILLGFLGGYMFYVFIQKYNIIIDQFTFYCIVINFAIVGTIATFYTKGIPIIVTQTYNIATSVILAWQLSHFNDWTAWTLLGEI